MPDPPKSTSFTSDRAINAAMEAVERLYSDCLAEHGPTPQAASWRDHASQQLRFAKLAHLLEPAPSEPVTVNDLGCGYGAMFEFLDSLPGIELAAYHGYDVSRPMLEAASANVDGRGHLHQSAETTEVADFSFVSGTFNFKADASNEMWSQHVSRLLLGLARHSRRGIAFNLLSTHVDYRDPNLFYANPIEFLGFSRERLSPHVALLHDYPLYEWTIIARRPFRTGEPLTAAWADLSS